MKINPIPCHDHDDYYNNPILNKLVDICLEHVLDDTLYNVALLLKNKSLSLELIDKFINSKFENNVMYSEIKNLISEIYSHKDVDNLRGVFLELCVFKFLKNKYSNENNFLIEKNCFVKIFDDKSDRTVDVFSIWDDNGFICECKIGYRGFEEHDICNLNKLYVTSGKILVPYIITLADKELLDDALRDILVETYSLWVHLGVIEVISLDNIIDFFSNKYI